MRMYTDWIETIPLDVEKNNNNNINSTNIN